MSLLKKKFALLKQGITLALSGELISHDVSNGNTARAGVRVNSDGTIDKREGNVYTQIDSSTDWRIPNGSGAGFYVRFSKGLFDPTPEIGTLDTWQEITSAREVTNENSANDSSELVSITVELSRNASDVEVSGSYPLTAVVGLPP